MHQAPLRVAVVSASLLMSLPSQTGNEVIFVGSSTSGSTDQHAFVESATGIGFEASNSHTDNVTGAVWTHSGRKLYVGQSLMDEVSVVDVLLNRRRVLWRAVRPHPQSAVDADGQPRQ